MAKPVRLLMSSASPFARKCMVVIRERGVTGIEETIVNSMDSPDLLTNANPIAQVPALIFDDGSSLWDSPLICAWLDAHAPGDRLTDPDDWAARRRETAGDGVMELAVRLRHEQLRPEGERSPSWQARWRVNINRALDVAEQDAGLSEGLDIGVLSWGCALSYLDFRHGDLGWRKGRPNLTALQARLDARPSFVETRP